MSVCIIYVLRIKICQFKHIFKFIKFISFKRINALKLTNIFYKYLIVLFLFKKTKGVKINYFRNNLLIVAFKKKLKGNFNLNLVSLGLLYSYKFLGLYSKYCKFLLYFNSFIKNKFICLSLKHNYFFRKYNNNKKSKVIYKLMDTSILNVFFKKRNIFFNISTLGGKTLRSTTTTREGYTGRNRNSYHSLCQVLKLMRSWLKIYFNNELGNIILKLKGWSKYRAAIKKILFVNGTNFQFKMIKYCLNIPHNGCRAPKRKNRKKNKRYFKRHKSLKRISNLV